MRRAASGPTWKGPTWPQVVARYGQATADRLVATGLLDAVTCTATPEGELDISGAGGAEPPLGAGTMTPLPCPFCGGTAIEVVIIDCRDREGLPAAMSCPDCGCHGPWDYIPDEAHTEKIILLWNKRVAP